MRIVKFSVQPRTYVTMLVAMWRPIIGQVM